MSSKLSFKEINRLTEEINNRCLRLYEGSYDSYDEFKDDIIDILEEI